MTILLIIISLVGLMGATVMAHTTSDVEEKEFYEWLGLAFILWLPFTLVIFLFGIMFLGSLVVSMTYRCTDLIIKWSTKKYDIWLPFE